MKPIKLKPIKLKPTKLREGSVSKLIVPPGARDAFLFDADLRGFGIRKQKTGRAKYFVKYSIRGKRTHVTLGSVERGNLAEMRKRANSYLREAMAGHDVAAERKAEAKRPAALLLGDLIDRYLADMEGKRRPRYVTELTRYLRKDWKPLHGMAAREITSDDVAPILENIATKHKQGPTLTKADRAKAALSACYSWALEPERHLVTDTPVKHFKARITSSRDRFLSEAELIHVWRACLNNDHGRIVRLLILTGQRRSEIADLSWSEINLVERQIELPAERTKNKRASLIPLSASALALLPERRDGREFVFGVGSGGFSGWSKAKGELDARVTSARKGRPLSSWTLHDLRRTFVTMMYEKGIAQPHIIEAIVNHISGHKAGVAGIYNRAAYYNEKRAALTEWSKYVASIIE